MSRSKNSRKGKTRTRQSKRHPTCHDGKGCGHCFGNLHHSARKQQAKGLED